MSHRFLNFSVFEHASAFHESSSFSPNRSLFLNSGRTVATASGSFQYKRVLRGKILRCRSALDDWRKIKLENRENNGKTSFREERLGTIRIPRFLLSRRDRSLSKYNISFSISIGENFVETTLATGKKKAGESKAENWKKHCAIA